MDQLNLSSENKLLVYCARMTMNEDITYNVKEILNRGLNWDYIIEKSRRHGIQSLLYWNLNRTDGGKNVPKEVMAKLKKMYYENAARNMLLYDELGTVLRALKDDGVDVISLKGAFLAEAVYRNIGLRPMSDIDLLIKKEDLHKVKKELARLGYSTPVYPTHLHEKIQNQLQNNEVHYINQGKKIMIDMHWGIVPSIIPFQVDINKFWENAQPVKIAGIETLMPAPEDSLLHLCLHLDEHINISNAPHPQFKGYSDIVAVIMHYEEKINWKYLVESSKNYGIEEPVYHGLYIASKLGAFVPSDVLDALKSVKSGIDFEGIISTRIMPIGDVKKKRQLGEISYFKDLVKVDGSRNKVRILLGDVFPCKEFMMQRYKIKNKKIVYAYYLIRFGTILRWGFRFLRQLLFHPVQRTADG